MKSAGRFRTDGDLVCAACDVCGKPALYVFGWAHACKEHRLMADFAAQRTERYIEDYRTQREWGRMRREELLKKRDRGKRTCVGANGK